MPQNGSPLSAANQAPQRADSESQTASDGFGQANQTASRTQTDQERPTNPKNDSQPINSQESELEAQGSPHGKEAAGRTSPESIHATNSESNIERGPDHQTTATEAQRPQSIHNHSSSGHDLGPASSAPEEVSGSIDAASGPDHRQNESVDRNDVTTPHGVSHSSDSSPSSSSTTGSNDSATEKRQGRARRTIHQDTVLDVETEVIEQVRENQTHRHSQHHEETRRIYPTSPPKPDNIKKKE